MTDDDTESPKVFISYSHDSREHEDLVRKLSNQLLSNGIHCNIDQYVQSPPESWPLWMEKQIEEADFVLLICTPTYLKRVMRKEEPGKGLGVLWEANIIYNYLYIKGVSTTKFVPILLPGYETSDIPVPLQGMTHFRPATDEEGYIKLYRFLLDRPRTPKPKTGPLIDLPSLKSETDILFSSPAPDKINQRNPLMSTGGDTLAPPGQTAVLEEQVKSREQIRLIKEPLASPVDDHFPKIETPQQSNLVKVMYGLFDSILATQSLAREAIKLFNRQEVYLDECNEALSALEAISKPAQELDRLVERHPSFLGQKRSELLIALHRIEDQADKLVIAKRASCPSCPDLPVEQRQEIQEQLKEIQVSIRKIQQFKKSLSGSKA